MSRLDMRLIYGLVSQRVWLACLFLVNPACLARMFVCFLLPQRGWQSAISAVVNFFLIHWLLPCIISTSSFPIISQFFLFFLRIFFARQGLYPLEQVGV